MEMNSDHSTGLRERQKLKSRERILTAAHDLIRATGSAGFSMRSVADGAELSLGTVYNFFGSKGALLQALLQTMVERLENEMDGLWRKEPLETLLTLAEAAGRHYAADPDFQRVLLRSVLGSNDIGDNGFDVGPSIKLYKRPVEAAIANGQLRSDVDAEVVARNLVTTFLGSLILWVREVIDGEELRIQVMYAFSVVLFASCTEKSRADLLKAQHRYQRQLTTRFFQNRAAASDTRIAGTHKQA
jgi:AcrR family transcriptional regulator